MNYPCEICKRRIGVAYVVTARSENAAEVKVTVSWLCLACWKMIGGDAIPEEQIRQASAPFN